MPPVYGIVPGFDASVPLKILSAFLLRRSPILIVKGIRIHGIGIHSARQLCSLHRLDSVPLVLWGLGKHPIGAVRHLLYSGAYEKPAII